MPWGWGWGLRGYAPLSHNRGGAHQVPTLVIAALSRAALNKHSRLHCLLDRARETSALQFSLSTFEPAVLLALFDVRLNLCPTRSCRPNGSCRTLSSNLMLASKMFTSCFCRDARMRSPLPIFFMLSATIHSSSCRAFAPNRASAKVWHAQIVCPIPQLGSGRSTQSHPLEYQRFARPISASVWKNNAPIHVG